MPHSPGPWRIEMVADRFQRVVNSEGVLVAEYHRQAEHDDPRRMADIQLIAAAPELVAALRKVTANLRGYEGEQGWDDAGVLEAEALLRRIEG